MHTIHFNSVKNMFKFHMQSSDLQIYQDANLSYFLLFFDYNKNIINVFSIEDELTNHVVRFIWKRYNSKILIRYSQLEKIKLSGFLVCIWLLDILNGGTPKSRNLRDSDEDDIIKQFIDWILFLV